RSACEAVRGLPLSQSGIARRRGIPSFRGCAHQHPVRRPRSGLAGGADAARPAGKRSTRRRLTAGPALQRKRPASSHFSGGLVSPSLKLNASAFIWSSETVHSNERAYQCALARTAAPLADTTLPARCARLNVSGIRRSALARRLSPRRTVSSPLMTQA